VAFNPDEFLAEESTTFNVDEFLAAPDEIQESESVATGSGGASWTALMQEGFVDDPQTKISIFAKNRFPDLPLGESRKRYAVVKDEIVYDSGEKNEKGDPIYYREKPEGVWSAAKDIISAIPSEGVKIAGEIAASIPSAKKGAELMPFKHPLAKGAGGIIGAATGVAPAAAAGEGYKQAVGEYFFDEEFSPEKVREETLNSVMGELVGGPLGIILSKVARGTGDKILGNIDIDKLKGISSGSIDSLVEKSKKLGLVLTPAEVSNLSRLKNYQRVLSQHPASADIFDEFYENRNIAMDDAFNKVINDISTSTSVLEGTKRGSREITQALDNATKARKNATENLYNVAFKADPMDATDLLKYMDKLGKMEVGGTGKAIDRVRKWLGSDTDAGRAARSLMDEGMSRTADKISLKNLPIEKAHNIRKELGDMIGTAKKSGAKSQARTLTKIREELTRNIEDASPKYKEANNKYAELSSPINELEDLFTPKVLAGEDRAVQEIGNLLFGPKSSDAHIRKAKAALIKQGADGEAAFQDLSAAYLRENLDKVSENLTGIMTPGQYKKALWKNNRGRKMLKASLGDQAFKNLEDFVDVATAIARGPQPNSMTWANLETNKELAEMAKTTAGRMGEMVGRMMKPGRWGDTMSEKNQEHFYAKVAKAFTDPNNADALKMDISKLMRTPAAEMWKSRELAAYLFKIQDVLNKEEQKDVDQVSAASNRINDLVGIPASL